MTPKTPILIVDDDKTIRKLLERVALRAGFEVDCAKDGVEALELLEKKKYEIAIVDLMMPRVSGYELVQKIGALNPRPAILVATAMASSDVASLDDSLVRRVIRKPFDIDAVAKALVETARQMAEQREQQNEEIAVPPVETATLSVGVNVAPEEEPTPIEEKPATTTDPAAVKEPPENVN